MTRTEHMLTIFAEECLEAAHRTTKALRFGLEEIQGGQSLTNAERLQEEMADVIGSYYELVRAGLVHAPKAEQVAGKRNKIAKYLEYSRACGTLTP